MSDVEHLSEILVELRVKMIEDVPEKLFLVLAIMVQPRVFGHLIEHVLCKVDSVLVTLPAFETITLMLKIFLLSVIVKDFDHTRVEN